MPGEGDGTVGLPADGAGLLEVGQALLECRRQQLAQQRDVPQGRPAPDPDVEDLSLARGGLHGALVEARPGDCQQVGSCRLPAPGQGGGSVLGDIGEITSHFPWPPEALVTVAAGRAWGSPGETLAIRHHLARYLKPRNPTIGWWGLEESGRESAVEREKTADDSDPCCSESVTAAGAKNYVSLGLAALQAEEAPVYRVWLLARLLDTAGSGWVATDTLREALCATGSPLRIARKTTSEESAWRNLRLLLNRGEGRYWNRETGKEGERLRYVPPQALGKALGVERLAGAPTIIPLATLSGSVGDFKAHLYASFHAGRHGGDDAGSPVSRAATAEMAGLSVRTLQRYDRRAGVETTANYEVGDPYDERAAQESTWEGGHAFFVLVDHKGRRGQPGRKYCARQLPNSYDVRGLETAPRGRQRKANTWLRDACDNGAQANDETRFERVFHTTAADASRSLQGSETIRSVYWRAGRTRSGARLWHVLKTA